MKNINGLFLLAFTFVSNIALHAQTVQVKNVSFEQEDNRIVVRYDLIGKPGKKYLVIMHGSDNSSRTYGLEPISVSGDVGKGVAAGYGKKIIWQLTADYPRGLEGETFVFKVDAVAINGKRKWPYVIIGVGLAVAAVIYFTWDKKGSVVIHMPDNY